MRFELYISIGSEDFDGSRFQEKVNVPGAIVKRIGHLGQQFDPVRFRAVNVWNSPRHDGSHNPEDDIIRLIENYAHVFCVLEENRASDVMCWVKIVGYYNEGEDPRGFVFSAETIRIISDIEASLSIDMVIDMSKA